MAHFAIVSPEYAGHLLSMGALGKELVRRGHRVTIVGRARAAPLAEQLGLPLHPVDMDDTPYPRSFIFWPAFRCLGLDWVLDIKDFFRWFAEGILRVAPPALKELAVDGALIDEVVWSGGTAAERAGVPFVTVCTGLPWNEELGVPPSYTSWPYAESRWARLRNRAGYAGWHWFTQPILKVINRYRTTWKLPRFSRLDHAFSPLAQVSQLCPEFDFPRRELPDVAHYIGLLATDHRVSNDHRFPWDRLDGRPLIFASLGTVAEDTNLPVFHKIMAACAGLEAQLVLALGQWNDEDGSARNKLGEIPNNAIVVDFAPQLALLDRSALLVTHAGVNTVLEALSRAVPMVALPRNVNQPAMGARIAHAGVGLVGSFQHATPRQIQVMVQRVLSEDSFRRRAKELQRAMLAAGGVSRAADIAEQALTTRRPVYMPKIRPQSATI